MTPSTSSPHASEVPASAPDAPPRATSSWRLIWDAVRGVHLDLTEAPLKKALIMLAIPMIMEMFMESIFAVVDVFWVAHLGATAVATVGLTESMMMIIYSLAMGVSIGVMALVARRVGEKDLRAAAKTATQGILLGLFISLCIGVVAAIYAEELLAVMGADAELVAEGALFTRVMLGGNASVFVLFLINAIFRGAGDAAFAMRVLWLGNILNMILGPCFIFGLGPCPELGVAGAAVGTTLGRGAAVVYQLYLLTRGKSRIVISRLDLGLDFRLMASVLRLSGSATLQMLISMTSYIGVMRILSTFGSEPLAGYTIGFRILMFALLPTFGLANAAATLVGQNLGAARPDRAEQAVWQACRLSAVVLSVVGVVFFLFAAPLTRLFTDDPGVIPYAVTYLRIVSLGFPFYAFGMVVSQSFNGAGDTRTPTYINVFVFWLFQLPVAWLLSNHTDLGASGVFIALASSFSLFAVSAVVLFRRGRWKTTHV